MDDWKKVETETSSTWDREGTIVGALIDKKDSVGPNESKMYVLETKDGNVAVWGSTVLDNKMGRVKVGEEVMIEALGKVKNPKTGRDYFNYNVFTREVPFTEVKEEEEDPEDDGVSVDAIPFD